MPDMKRTIKDSLFSYIFKEPEYTRKLYLSLHPEDTDVREEDFKLVTLATILTNGIYNDLGVLVRDRIILLVEAQSTFSVNLALRMLLYLATTYKEYVEEQKLDLYAPKQITVPRPELYVVYTGTQDVPDVLRLSDLYDGSGSVEVEVKVLRGDTGGKDDIVYQYVRFCRIADGQRRIHGPTQLAVEATIRQCLEEGILVPILASRQKEVNIMVTLYDQEKVMEIHDYNTRMVALEEGIGKGREEGLVKGREEGREEGLVKGREEGISAMISTLKELEIDKDVVVQKIMKRFNLLPHVAETKVEQYWKQ